MLINYDIPEFAFVGDDPNAELGVTLDVLKAVTDVCDTLEGNLSDEVVEAFVLVLGGLAFCFVGNAGAPLPALNISWPS